MLEKYLTYAEAYEQVEEWIIPLHPTKFFVGISLISGDPVYLDLNFDCIGEPGTGKTTRIFYSILSQLIQTQKSFVAYFPIQQLGMLESLAKVHKFAWPGPIPGYVSLKDNPHQICEFRAGCAGSAKRDKNWINYLPQNFMDPDDRCRHPLIIDDLSGCLQGNLASRVKCGNPCQFFEPTPRSPSLEFIKRGVLSLRQNNHSINLLFCPLHLKTQFTLQEVNSPTVKDHALTGTTAKVS